jgi:acetyl-CoA carboxylase biotin carboxyl carrier protein
MIVSSSEDAIKRVVEAFERSDWTEIDVRSGNLRVHLSTSAPATPPNATDCAPRVTARSAPDGPADDRDVPQREAPATVSVDPPPGSHVVVSPSPGILWRSPEPGAPPFADLGHHVDGSATVCIIEVMKLMNHVKAGVSGEVVAVYGENGVAVKKGQALFAIAPSGPSS